MKHQFDYFETQLVRAGLVEPGKPVMGFLDAGLSWNRENDDITVLEKIFSGISINSILFSEPAEPYKTILDYLAKTSGGVIHPEDCETRTFLHDLPVTDRFEPETILPALKERKSVIVSEKGIITYGSVSIEQAFVTFSSVCFAGFVKFFSDYLFHTQKKTVPAEMEKAFQKAVSFLPEDETFENDLMPGPLDTEEKILMAMDEAGKRTVNHRLVDSYFGNISFRDGETLYISQTGSSLDALPGCIDPCRLDGTSCAGITASSEFVAHVGIVNQTGHNAILHGHPKFCVILSMDCPKEECQNRGLCHLKCATERFVCDIPIVPGEVGTGTYGLCNTVPPAIKNRPGAIVYGHGLFTTAKTDFNEAFKNLLEIENECRREYFRRVRK